MFQLPRMALVLAAMLVAPAALANGFYKPGEVIVKYKNNIVRTNAVMTEMYNDVGIQSVKYFNGMMSDFEQLILKPGVSVQDAVKSLEQTGLVEYAQPNYLLFTPEVQSQLLKAIQQAKKKQEAPPCIIPGIPFPPGCEDGGGGGGGDVPCIIPGIPFPPGCVDGGDGGGGGGGNPPAERPKVENPPAEGSPVADPDNAKAWGLEKIQATSAWKEFPGDRKFIVAVIDTGIDYNHKDLSLNVWRNPSPTNNDVVGFDFIHNDGLPYDDQGHGTHCSGSIGAVGENGFGISGVSQKVSIMGLKFLSSSGQGSTADAIKAIDYAIAKGARVLSNSWGSIGADPDNNVLEEAINRAEKAGVLFVAAAGNGNQFGMGQDNDSSAQRSYPASFTTPNIISVAATDKNDGLASFSNYGKKSVHLGAPGVGVYSAAPGSKYATHDGTSMACPHVAGAAALLWSKHPDWDYKKVKEVLIKTTDPVASLANKSVSGGRLNILKAISFKE
ncbi:MAG: S8 family peptidase [Bacteriovoracia bacterium]